MLHVRVKQEELAFSDHLPFYATFMQAQSNELLQAKQEGKNVVIKA